MSGAAPLQACFGAQLTLYRAGVLRRREPHLIRRGIPMHFSLQGHVAAAVTAARRATASSRAADKIGRSQRSKWQILWDQPIDTGPWLVLAHLIRTMCRETWTSCTVAARFRRFRHSALQTRERVHRSPTRIVGRKSTAGSGRKMEASAYLVRLVRLGETESLRTRLKGRETQTCDVQSEMWGRGLEGANDSEWGKKLRLILRGLRTAQRIKLRGRVSRFCLQHGVRTTDVSASKIEMHAHLGSLV
ncbi:hypothetical protein B0H19DRAFT_1068389 [Mycena capillaripes]|nr:hypothetical protein B0H19DRAFT_1068389 [Mycena capillaripes]